MPRLARCWNQFNRLEEATDGDMSQNKKLYRGQKGQSLVEVALIAPVLIVLIAGLVEVTQLAVTQNRISTAARNAARFAANGGEDVGVRDVALNTITQTLDMSSGVWDIWSIRAAVDNYGDIHPDSFLFEHIYGDGLTTEYTATNIAAFEDELRLRVQEDLKRDGTDTTIDNLGAGLEVVGVYILHDVESIIGLNIMPNLLGFNTVTGYSVMRQASLATTIYTTGGCKGIFPIAVEENVQTITEAEYESLVFSYPAAKPAWETFSNQPPGATPLPFALEGNIFKLDVGTDIGDFNWLKWNTAIVGINPPPAGHSILATSLLWPGNANDYADRGDPPGGGTFRGYANVSDSDDHDLQKGDWVAQDTISGGFGGAGVNSALQDHITTDRALRMVLWNDSAGGHSGNSFQASGFGIFRVRAYGSNWLLLEMVRLDSSCGQV